MDKSLKESNWVLMVDRRHNLGWRFLVILENPKDGKGRRTCILECKSSMGWENISFILKRFFLLKNSEQIPNIHIGAVSGDPLFPCTPKG